jgi:hypothetical protein
VYQGCTVGTDCLCPLTCFNDPGLGGLACEGTCTQSSDCTDLLSDCSGGSCVVNFCVSDLSGNSLPGSFGQICDGQDAGSGTCVPLGSNGIGGQAGICVQGGEAAEGGECLPWIGFETGSPQVFFPIPDPSTQSAELCVPGDFCVDLDGGTGVCMGLGDGGCVQNLGSVTGQPTTELVNCQISVQCECPASCVTDGVFGFTGCETPCSSDSDCPLAFEACEGDAGFCTPYQCATDISGNSIYGVLNGYCGPGDAGVCFAESTGASLFGLCILTGDAGAQSPCDPLRLVSNPSLLCSGGLFCLSGAIDGGSVCEPLCDPSSDAGCSGPNETCLDYSGGLATNLGICCLPTGSTCTDTQGCCNGCDTTGLCL